MSGTFNIGGLVSGLDTNTIISQLIQIERQPITRLQQKVTRLQRQRTAIQNVRTALTTLRNRLQDFNLNNIFTAFKSTSSDTSVVQSNVSDSNPVLGTYQVEVIQLASATVANSSGRVSSSIDPNVALENSGLTTTVQSGTFTINGVEFTVDPTTQSLNDIVSMINSSSAGVTATYNASEDRIYLQNTTPGDTTRIVLGSSNDTSNLISALGWTNVVQYTNGNGSTELRSRQPLGAINTGVKLQDLNLQNGAITGGSFSINGFSITIDPTSDTLADIISRINASDAGVTASYDSLTDTLRFVARDMGSRLIRFGGTSDTSNFLSVMNLTSASQTAGSDAIFKINGGAEETRNSNVVTDAITGTTLTFLKTGTSTITIDTDEDAVVGNIQNFLTTFNNAIKQIRESTASGADLSNESSIREISSYLQQTFFNTVSGISGQYQSLVDIGFSTGSDFDSSAIPSISLDVDTFKEALRNNKTNVVELFSNSSSTGLVDTLFPYLDEITGYNGFLNERIKTNGSIDSQINSINEQISRIEYRVSQKETRLRRQFTLMEQMMQSLQGQNRSLSRLGSTLT
ncbi:MAG: flagellar filament capping protein FliD [Candidatus Hydrogenedens sp.]